MKRVYLICVLLVVTTGCARVNTAAHKAFFNPNTLIPLVGAGIFSIDDFDERVSRWATKHCPIYGSPENAKRVSDSIKSVLEIETYVTALAVKESKLERLGIEWATFKAVGSTTNITKETTSRTRPNGTNDLSFPSACTSFAFTGSTLSNLNLDYIDMRSEVKEVIKIGNVGLASSVAWARVERGAHYPSDVLAGAALGHFMSAFIHNLFLTPKDERASLAIVPIEGGAMARLSYSF